MMLTQKPGAHSIGWLTSLCLHATLAFGALVVTQRITLAPQQAPFMWNVAMVAAPAESPQPFAAPSVTSHVPVSKPRSLGSLSSTSTMSADSTRAVTVEPTLPHSDEPMVFKNEDPVAKRSPPLNEPEQARAVEEVMSPPQAVVSNALPPEPTERPPQPQEAISPAETASTALVSSTPRPDYGWLFETILRRMQELKKYPAEARLDHAEGKVVLKAVIRSNGSIETVEVFQSSGHQTLDRAAVELLNLAAPFHFPRPLDKPQMTVKIPMNYRLE